MSFFQHTLFLLQSVGVLCAIKELLSGYNSEGFDKCRLFQEKIAGFSPTCSPAPTGSFSDYQSQWSLNMAI